MSNTIDPIITKDGDTTIWTHPAFAQVTVNRISGQTVLYGSDFRHNGFVRVTVYQSELRRDLSNDWHYGKRKLVEFDLSEAQWGAMVSSFGMGDGTPCTLTSFNGERMPGIPLRDEAHLFKVEANEALKKTVTRLKTLRDKIEAGVQGLSKTRQQEMLTEVNGAINALASSLPFIADEFGEHMEKRQEKAKSEIHGYMTRAIQRAGLEAMQGNAPLVIEHKPNDTE